jgi:hypothetical protein
LRRDAQLGAIPTVAAGTGQAFRRRAFMTFKCAKCSSPVEISEEDLDSMEKENILAKAIRQGGGLVYCAACVDLTKSALKDAIKKQAMASGVDVTDHTDNGS